MEFTFIFLSFLPFIFLLWLANVADKRRGVDPGRKGLDALVYALLGGMWLTLAAAGIAMLLMGVAYARYADINAMKDLYRSEGVDPETMVAVMRSLPRLGAGFVVLAVAGLLTLLPRTRRLLARALAISSDSMVHMTALSYSVIIFVNMWLMVGIGIETFLGMMEESARDAGVLHQMLLLFWSQNMALAWMAMVGVGWLSRRSWRHVLQRLGWVWPNRGDVAVGAGLGVVMFILLIPAGLLMRALGMDIDADIEKLTQTLLGPLLTTLPGVLSLGLAAALGEELVFRGALQPRFGVFLTALLFAFTHSQYVLSPATLVVFVLGLALGWVRMRRNTTTAMILHATYNIAIGLMGLLAMQMMQ